jgi:formate hydrogenlyase transcriptional activator
MDLSTRSSVEGLSKIESPQNGSDLFSSESVLSILKLILAVSPLPDVLTIIARLVESQNENMFCTIWLPDDTGGQLRCAAAPSLLDSVLMWGA